MDINGVKFVKDIIPKDPKKRSGRIIEPTTLTVHSTANPKSNALGERGWLTNTSNNRSASWHECVDDKMLVQAIPLNEEAYHAGNRTGNRTSISIEICESGNRVKTLENAVKVVAYRLYERGWGIDRLRRHFDWSGKICPRIMSENNWALWNIFKTDVSYELKRLKGELEETEEEEMIKYRNFDDLPSWAEPTIRKLYDGGYIKGVSDKELNLDLTEAEIKVYVVHDRMGLYDK